MQIAYISYVGHLFLWISTFLVDFDINKYRHDNGADNLREFVLMFVLMANSILNNWLMRTFDEKFLSIYFCIIVIAKTT